MIEIVKVEPRQNNLNVTTVLLNNNKDTVLKNWHCGNCGRIVFNYFNEIKIIIVGEMREVARPIDIMCSRCGWIFRII